MAKNKVECSGRAELEDLFDGDLEAYAEHTAGLKPEGVENDLHHPWHQRKLVAKLTVDLPDDSVAPPHLTPLYTRAEICEMAKISDSTFGKWDIPSRSRAGKYSLYALSDVIFYRAARAYIAECRRQGKFKKKSEPTETIDQIAARIQAEAQNELGPVKYWTPPEVQAAPESSQRQLL